jgi:hypothetical protein
MANAVDPRPRIERRWYSAHAIGRPGTFIVDTPGPADFGDEHGAGSNVICEIVGLNDVEVQQLLDEHNGGR